MQISTSISRILILMVIILSNIRIYAGCGPENPVPFSTNTTHLTIWSGQDYEPIFLKGMNLGVSLPGKFPGELEVSREQYGRWLQMINDAGFNNVRLYTLHYPDFYEVLDSFNLANKHNPLFFFQGVWLEEELEGYEEDLYFLTESFLQEIEENVDCVHGNRTIAQRPGKAWGNYTADVSRWNMGYIIGREVHPGEVLYTNYLHAGDNAFSGQHFAIEDASPTESWVVSKLDHLVSYEFANYATQRPISFSSWPTLDPIDHPEEWNPWEDTISIDMSKLQLHDAPAGYFASYHAYPYYPDYISYDPNYIGFSDDYGPNSYLGYLTFLKEHYNQFPLIIAEYGVPSSWGKAHYATSGMHHGGFDHYGQGEANIRMLKTMESAMCGGGMQFAWMDEWFKRTWVTDHIDYLMDRRVLWHNVTAAEQNYGLIGFQRPLALNLLEEFCDDCFIERIEAAADFDFFHIHLQMKEMLGPLEELWISLDTYDATLGESILPSGHVVENRAEFVLHITNHSAKLYVTEAYDLYGIFHGVSAPEQLYHSIPTDGAPWRLVRWKINEFDQDIQYIGNLQVNFGFLPENSKDAVTIFTDKIHIRIPWSLLHFVDPSEYVVFHNYQDVPGWQDTISDGIALSVFYQDEEFAPTDRFLWENWNHALEAEEYIKGSYWVMKDRLHEFNNRAIAVCDSFLLFLDGEPAWVDADSGVLANDFDLDGYFMQALVLDPPAHGSVQLNLDGSFTYRFNGGSQLYDSFTYTVFDGYSLSAPAIAHIYLDHGTFVAELPDQAIKEDNVIVYPNPVRDILTVRMNASMDYIYLFDSMGQMLLRETASGSEYKLNVSGYAPGTYLLKVQSGNNKQVRKISVF
ncbi:MAG: T9SS C-terminal target domain-containing protein [Bacteroidetes bacterium]|nr:MAG: T9SS C-terminal target domain-containing protein [Bacteroidota bacterium]